MESTIVLPKKYYRFSLKIYPQGSRKGEIA